LKRLERNSARVSAHLANPGGDYRARYYDPSGGRFLSEDPVRFSSGDGNFYRYVANSPLNARDPAGLWSTKAHNQMVWNAFKDCKGVSKDDIYQMQLGSEWLDENTQGSEGSYMHSMSDGNGSEGPNLAKYERDRFVQQQMSNAQTVLNAGGRSQAMFIFGVAMHPLMDMTSPAHTDAQGNPIPWCGLTGGCSQTHLHGGDSYKYPNPMSIEDVSHLNTNPYIQQMENLIMQSWFEALTGKKLDCGCSK
jgi:hypothetical protein